MHRRQVHIKDAVGQIMGQPIVSKTEQEILIPVGSDKFAIIGAVGNDDQGYLETTLDRIPFVYGYYDWDELAKVFDADQLQEMKLDHEERLLARESEQKRVRYERYIQLKAEFDPSM